MHLIRRSQAGDAEAFAALFEQYKNLVYKTAFLMLDNAAEAEDALQEVFVLVHKGLRGFDPHKGAFSTWLYRVTVNYCLNHRRRRSFFYLPLEQAPPPLVDPPGASLAEEESIRQAIRELSEKQRAVVILRYYWELPYAEISRILDIPLGTVKSRLDLALRTLRRALEAQDEEIASAPSPEREVSR
jgi:RNA polymerase sigma-70 factor (ECF subfamily)